MYLCSGVNFAQSSCSSLKNSFKFICMGNFLYSDLPHKLNGYKILQLRGLC
ncbi:hypothetical protein KsCSTR_22070 [Candidatus Kuenenia stuttgartiensis]|uniref:Uncharacterized protein n=1 Tax=Kuenenia stuttgartiensis TaxID=174633 RepID=Q1Q398_KUEST|nr:hypothetical protein KsCSTR_22070 [Candidatus Kuenenia stuttgartiensis]CAJ74486.1 unknown protein [Candidatus Kuenenia stuttgartiensis]